jgi:hypothetical protein
MAKFTFFVAVATDFPKNHPKNCTLPQMSLEKRWAKAHLLSARTMAGEFYRSEHGQGRNARISRCR